MFLLSFLEKLAFCQGSSMYSGPALSSEEYNINRGKRLLFLHSVCPDGGLAQKMGVQREKKMVTEGSNIIKQQSGRGVACLHTLLLQTPVG